MHESLNPLNRPKFSPGRVVATPAALAALEESGQAPLDLLERHLRLEQGQLRPDDYQLNRQALKSRSALRVS